MGVTALSNELVERLVEAYGGEARWRAATAVETRISMGGMLLRMKGHPQRTLRDMRARTEIARPHVRVEPIDDKGNVGVLDGQTVRLETPEGNVLEERQNVRARFPYGKRLLKWDRLDAFYFIGYTQWTYNAFPALLWRDDVTWRQVSDTALEVEFAPELPTHSRLQRYHVDAATGLLRQLDYTAEVFGPWAKAAHVIEEHGTWEGIPFPSKRRVWSRRREGSARTSPAPLMILLDVHEWRLN
jgi:hypothetical protein